MALTSSYNPTCLTPRSFRPNHKTPAVMPLPQLVMMDLSPFKICSKRMAPTASTKAWPISAVVQYVVYLVEEWEDEWVCRKDVKGMLSDCGM